MTRGKKKTQTQRRRRTGRLMVIGGGEDRKNDKEVLRRLLELTGRADPRVVVLTAASRQQDEMWAVYDQAFGDLGAGERVPLALDSRDEANDPRNAEQVRNADVLFMTGGDQKRLLTVIGGTAVDAALQVGVRELGLCIAGTSAGASAMSDYMLATGDALPLPGRDMAGLAAGLGLLQRVVIDQHFSQRQRLARLLSIVAQNPTLLGVGIDEDTALVIEPDNAIEVVGSGAVTVIDGSRMRSNFLEVERRETMELENVVLHLLPAGRRYDAKTVIAGNVGAEPLNHCGIAKAVSVLTTLPSRGQLEGSDEVRM